MSKVEARRLAVRDVPGAYIGRHVEVVGADGERVWPPPERSEPKLSHHGALVSLGCSRVEAEGFVAGYEFAREEAGL